MKLASFDIFDTTLLRLCDNESNVFWILAQTILGDDAPISHIAEFIRIRTEAEITARKQNNQTELTTEEIYEYADYSSLTATSKHDILFLEYEIQSNVLFPRQIVVDLIEKYRSNGYTICFISDMHLPHNIILNVLKKYSIICNNEELFVSSKIGCTKCSGQLFCYVRKHYKNIREWHHFGDNVISDVKVPNSMGIKAHRIKLPKSPFYSNHLLNKIYTSHPVSLPSLLGGIQKYLTEGKDDYSKLISEIVSPLFVSFVYKMMRDSVNRHINKLYFFSRDGYVLYKIAQEFSSLFPQLELHYLYVSRRTLYLPSISDISLEAFINLKDTKGLSTKEYLDQFHVNSDHLQYEKTGNTQSELQSIFSNRQNIDTIKKEKTELTYKLTLYLQQEEFFDGKIAMVDMTGSRSSQKAINILLEQNGKRKIFAYYFFVSEDRKSIKEAGDFNACIYADYLKESPYKCLGDLVLLFEDVFSKTDQNRVIDYCISDEKWIPITCQSRNNNFDGYVESNICIYTLFAKLYILNKVYLYNEEVLQGAIYTAASFAQNPYYRYVKSLSSLSFSESGTKQSKIIENPLTKKKGLWYRGSLISIGPYMNIVFCCMIKLKEWIKKCQ